MSTALWIAHGKEYSGEAGRSSKRVRQVMPEVKTEFFAPVEPHHSEWFIEQTRCLLEMLARWIPDGEKVLWLDSDTYMVEPVPELFEMLDNYELALAHAPGHHTAPTLKPLPDCFPECNIGVIAMVNSQPIRELWQQVYWRQVNHPEVYGDNDQAALREELWDRRWRFAVLPSEYNCRFNFGCQVRDRVKILHGRPPPGITYEEIAASINEGYQEGDQIAPRIWVPQYVPG